MAATLNFSSQSDARLTMPLPCSCRTGSQGTVYPWPVPAIGKGDRACPKVQISGIGAGKGSRRWSTYLPGYVSASPARKSPHRKGVTRWVGSFLARCLARSDSSSPCWPEKKERPRANASARFALNSSRPRPGCASTADATLWRKTIKRTIKRTKKIRGMLPAVGS